jgi:regulator of sigma E protease
MDHTFIPHILANKLLPVLGAVLGFSFLITMHEFGHFIFCKLFNVRTPTFSIGYGPAILQKKIGDTVFCISAIPIGGYLEIGGLAEPGQGSQEHANDLSDRSFSTKNYFQKVLILGGGVLFNFITAYLLYLFLFTSGMPRPKITQVKLTEIVENLAADKHGLKAGDAITGLDGKKFTDQLMAPMEFHEYIQKHPNADIELEVERNGRTITKKVGLGAKEGSEADPVGQLGAHLMFDYTHAPGERTPFFTSVVKAWHTFVAQIYIILGFVKRLFAQRDLSEAAGPLMIFSMGSKMASGGPKLLLYFLAYLSVALAIMNLLPIGALDGGQILFVTIEAIIRRDLPEIIKLSVNLASWVFFIGLTIFITYRDIIRIWFS